MFWTETHHSFLFAGQYQPPLQCVYLLPKRKQLSSFYCQTFEITLLPDSVLCGSEKYPSRDPFAHLLKGSLQTFLNAMTYPDRTVYPVSACMQ